MKKINNEFAVVLGYSYWNAMYWLVSAESWRKAPLRSSYKDTHPYYKNLYNLESLRILDEVTSISLLYDEIYLSPADCPLPDYHEHTIESNYTNTSLGLYSSWQWMEKFRLSEEMVNKLEKELHNIKIPKSIGEEAKNIKLVLQDIIVQINLSKDFNCQLLVGKEFQDLYQYVSNFVMNQETFGRLQESGKVVKSFDVIQKTTGLGFSLESFEEFKELKSNNIIKRYGSAMRKKISSIEPDQMSEFKLLETMLNAINTSAISNKIGNGMNLASKFLSLASLFPGTGIGEVAGIGGLTLEYMNSKRNQISPYWWALVPEINNSLFKFRIEQRYKELKEKIEL